MPWDAALCQPENTCIIPFLTSLEEIACKMYGTFDPRLWVDVHTARTDGEHSVILTAHR